MHICINTQSVACTANLVRLLQLDVLVLTRLHQVLPGVLQSRQSRLDVALGVVTVLDETVALGDDGVHTSLVGRQLGLERLVALHLVGQVGGVVVRAVGGHLQLVADPFHHLMTSSKSV